MAKKPFDSSRLIGHYVARIVRDAPVSKGARTGGVLRYSSHALRRGRVQWFYDCVALEYVRGDDVVHIEIDASCVILRVEWTQRSVERLRLDLNRVRGFSIDRDEGQDVLVVHLVDPRASDLRLRLAPTVHLHWGHLAC